VKDICVELDYCCVVIFVGACWTV